MRIEVNEEEIAQETSHEVHGSCPANTREAPVQPLVQNQHEREVSGSTERCRNSSVPGDPLVRRKVHDNL